MQLARGHYKTIGGHEAFVSRIKSAGMAFIAQGSVKCGETGVLHLTAWDLTGQNISGHPMAQFMTIDSEVVES